MHTHLWVLSFFMKISRISFNIKNTRDTLLIECSLNKIQMFSGLIFEPKLLVQKPFPKGRPGAKFFSFLLIELNRILRLKTTI